VRIRRHRDTRLSGGLPPSGTGVRRANRLAARKRFHRASRGPQSLSIGALSVEGSRAPEMADRPARPEDHCQVRWDIIHNTLYIYAPRSEPEEKNLMGGNLYERLRRAIV